MTLRPLLLALLFLFPGLLPARAAEPSSPVANHRRLNVLLITADDLGLQLGCYGDPVARTPELDRFAAGATRFANAYVTAASCSPSRSSLLTGLYPHQNGQVGLAYKNSGYAMRPDVQTLPARLKAAGYRTGILGKLHVYPEASFPFDLDLSDYTKLYTRDLKATADAAAGFFAAAGNDPFFLMVNYTDPHEPFENQVKGLPVKPFQPGEVPPFPFAPPGGGPAFTPERMAGYYNGVARLDALVGALLARLEAAGRAGDTLVIFLGDNGPPFPRAKMSCYEAGVRVPWIVRWPGRGKPGSVSEAFVSGVDVTPAALEAAGQPVPPERELAGRSFARLLEGDTTGARETVATESTSHTTDLWQPRRAIRDRQFKLIVNLQPERKPHPPAEELYDLAADPHERRNLAADPAVRPALERLRGQLDAWRRETADPLLDPAGLAAATRVNDELVARQREAKARAAEKKAAAAAAEASTAEAAAATARPQ